MRPPNASGMAPHRSLPQQSASLRHVPVPAPAADDAQNVTPVGATRQLAHPTGQGLGEQALEQALLTHTSAELAQVPHEARPHLAGSLPGPQVTPGASHCGSQHAPALQTWFTTAPDGQH
jgi:hypothetical protein